jgi:hypothetical protein
LAAILATILLVVYQLVKLFDVVDVVSSVAAFPIVPRCLLNDAVWFAFVSRVEAIKCMDWMAV